MRCLLVLLACCCLAALLPGCAAAGRGAQVGHEDDAEAAGIGPAELTMATFNHSMAAAEAPYSLCEFFASWCPACMNFKVCPSPVPLTPRSASYLGPGETPQHCLTLSS